MRSSETPDSAVGSSSAWERLLAVCLALVVVLAGAYAGPIAVLPPIGPAGTAFVGKRLRCDDADGQAPAFCQAQFTGVLHFAPVRDRPPGPKLGGLPVPPPAWVPVPCLIAEAPAAIRAGDGFRADRPTIVQLPSCGPPAPAAAA